MKKPGYRYEKCRHCGLIWNVAIDQEIPAAGYLCPQCTFPPRRDKSYAYRHTAGHTQKT